MSSLQGHHHLESGENELCNMTLKITQINMQHSKTANAEIIQAIDKGETDVVLIQEPYCYKGKIPGIGSRVMAITPPQLQNGSPGSAILLRSRAYTMLYLSDLSDVNTTTVQISGSWGELYLVTCYFKFADGIEGKINMLDRIVTKLRGKKVLIAADSNASSPLWDPIVIPVVHDDRRYSRGRKLERFITEKGLITINRPELGPTFRGNIPGKGTYIDVTLVTVEAYHLITSWDIKEDFCTSDHNAIEICINNNAHPHAALCNAPRYNVRKAKWDTFDQVFRERIMAIHNCTTPDELVGCFQSSIEEASVADIPIRKWFPRTNPGWNNEIFKMKKQSYKLRKKLQYAKQRNLPSLTMALENYRTARNSYKKALLKSRQKSWEQFVNRAGSQDPWGIPYKAAMGKLRREIPLHDFT